MKSNPNTNHDLVGIGKTFWNDSMQDLYYFIFFNRKCFHYCTWFKTFGELIQLSFKKEALNKKVVKMGDVSKNF
jgi:hypothetical protein